MKTIVRLQEIELIQFKNVERGKIRFPSYGKKSEDKRISDIIGLYGQNGSGKTAFIEALQFFKIILSGEGMPKHSEYLIQSDKSEAILKFVFMVISGKDRYLVYYNVAIRKKDEGAEIWKESISIACHENNKWEKRRRLLEYEIEDEEIIRPLIKQKELIQNNKENLQYMEKAKFEAIEKGNSFIFSKECCEIFGEYEIKKGELFAIPYELFYYAKYNFYLIQNEYLGIIHMHQFLPLSFRIDNYKHVISGDLSISLFDTSTVSKETFDMLSIIIEQVNIVLGTIVQGLSIDIVYKGEEKKNNEKKVIIQLVSVNHDMRIPLKYESDGIKKIISILSAMIAMYNDESICLVVDELDASIYEYLLGEILSVLQDGAKGQFIFTSHNLRALETLKKESIVLTTTNPINRYVQITKVRRNHNLRDTYLRAIALGGQKETIYAGTNSFEIAYAFRKARNAIEK